MDSILKLTVEIQIDEICNQLNQHHSVFFRPTEFMAV